MNQEKCDMHNCSKADLQAEIARREAKAPAVIVRAYSGVFFGLLEKKEGASVELRDARQIWSWDSTGMSQTINTCPDIATHGVGSGSKVSEPAPRAFIEQVGAVFFCTHEAKMNISRQKWALK